MQRRNFIRNSSLALAGLAFLSNKTLAQLLADPTWKIKMLTDTTIRQAIFLLKD